MTDSILAVSLIGALITGAAVLLAVRAVRLSREQAETARLEAGYANQMKNEFVSMVSHELRTPLTSIAGFADTLRASWRSLPGEEVDEFLRIITAQAHHLGELVEDVLVIPRLEAGRLQLDMREFDLAEVTREVTDVLFPVGSGREAAVAIATNVRPYADRKRVQQILRNLCENARKYGGDQILVEGTALGHLYMVVVGDNGPGVPLEHRERIFEHFEQVTKGDARSEDGIGLGLPIARRLARSMGGDLWYEDRFPTGSKFCFTLPIKTDVLAELDPGAHERGEESESQAS